MEAPPTRRLRFRWSWRPYQARVLRTVERHLEDSRLHIVAAPGAGKTTLGLEVFRRLDKPALALAPSLTIRDQWLRGLEDFFPDGATSAERDWIDTWTSRDLEAPAFFTVATYQAVLSGARKDTSRGKRAADSRGVAPSEEAVATVATRLRAARIGTLILDEAHHLRKEWWRALERLVASLGEVTVLSLTATPPYDATGHEWHRYEKLCGPIDDEISVPELVKAGTLCPHQDFVYAVAPQVEEESAVAAHERAVRDTLDDLTDDPAFQAEVDAHPWVSASSPDTADVLDRPELAVALLSYLRSTAASLPAPLLDLLALDSGDLPAMDRSLWQVLLREYLYGSTFETDAPSRSALRGRLRERGLLWRRRLRIVRSRPAERLLALSASKVHACVDVHRHERTVRGDGLRQVVLTDFIRDDSVDAVPGSVDPDLGAFPVFDALTSSAFESDTGDALLVTGRLTVIHRSRSDELAGALGEPTDVRFSPLPHRPAWLRVEGVATGRLVAACTALLSRGSVRVVVGTRSLLGEGWDAPSVNSLILASFVGAFVSTNQMRGRAIRADSARADKVSSVWHLVTVSPDTPTGIMDLHQLRRRFATFVGLSADGASIESGFDRLDLPELASSGDLDAFNRVSLERSRTLGAIGESWRSAIEASGTGQVVPTVRFRSPPTLAPLHIRHTLRYVLYEAAGAALLGVAEVLRGLAFGPARALGVTLLVSAAVPMALLTPRLYRAARLALRHAPVDGSVAQIGRALLEALDGTGLLEGDDLAVHSDRLADGSAQVSLEGGTFHDQSLFADAMAEMLGPVDNPRYLLTRPATGRSGAPVDFHAVPGILGSNRERADRLHRAWTRHVGDGDLVYTRRAGGRAVLLSARARSFSNQFVDPGERVDRWR